MMMLDYKGGFRNLGNSSYVIREGSLSLGCMYPTSSVQSTPIGLCK